MADVVVVCVDGSELGQRSVAAGLGVVRGGVEPVVATVMDAADPTLVSGTGLAGGSMSPADFERYESGRREEAERIVRDGATALGLEGARQVVLLGHPGTAICDLAEQESAVAIVIGSRGQGGLKRAVLGSVSDHVVRNAPCPVVVTAAGAAEEG